MLTQICIYVDLLLKLMSTSTYICLHIYTYTYESRWSGRDRCIYRARNDVHEDRWRQTKAECRWRDTDRRCLQLIASLCSSQVAGRGRKQLKCGPLRSSWVRQLSKQILQHQVNATSDVASPSSETYCSWTLRKPSISVWEP